MPTRPKKEGSAWRVQRFSLTPLGQEMATKNYYLCTYYADRIYKRDIYRSVSFEDLMDAAVSGLILAVAHFNPNRGVRFSTFATKCMRGCMYQRNYEEQRRLRRTPPMDSEVMQEEVIDHLSDTDDSRDARELVDRLIAHANSLPEKRKQIMLMRLLEGHDNLAIAKAVGCTRAYVSIVLRTEFAKFGKLDKCKRIVKTTTKKEELGWSNSLTLPVCRIT